MSHLEREEPTELKWPLTNPRLDEVKTWIQSVLSDMSEVVGPTRIYAQYADSPDIRITARFEPLTPSEPKVVFKANYFPLLVGSSLIAPLLSSHCTGMVPNVLAYERREGGSFLLYREFEGELVSELRSPEVLLDVARVLGKIQSTIATLPETETASLPLLEIARLPVLFAEVLAHLRRYFAVAWARDEGILTQWLGFPAVEVLDRLEPLADEVKAWTQALATSRIPLSVDHGDLHAGNAVRQPDSSILVFDWENACLSCPFFSVEKLMVSAWSFDTQTEETGPWGWVSGTPTQLALKEAYLNAVSWESHEERDRLFDIAMCLATIKEMHSELIWAETMNWDNGNPEWTAQLISRLLQYREAMRKTSSSH